MWSRSTIGKPQRMFWVAGELFDLQFKQITNVPVYHADVRFGKFQIKRRGNSRSLVF
jgi:peptidyl-dipeptidase Dcp